MKIKNKIKITVNGKQMSVISNYSLKNLIYKLNLPLKTSSASLIAIDV